MEYPAFEDGCTLTARQKLTYCLGAIAEMDAILTGFLRDICKAVGVEADTARFPSGRCLEELRPRIKRPVYDWVPECRAAVTRIGAAVKARNDALHSEWMRWDGRFTSNELIRARQEARPLEYFERVHALLDVAVDNAVGVLSLARATNSLRDGKPPDPEFVAINRANAARTN